MTRTDRGTSPRQIPSARERLLQAALHRFATQGAVGVTLEDVRQTAGVSVGALYHHFADKAALLDALYVELTADFQAGFLAELRSHASAEAGIKGGVRFYLRWVSRHREAASVLLGHRPGSEELRVLNRRFFAAAMEWWATHAQYGALRELNFDLIHALWLGSAQEYTRHWIGGHARRPPVAAAEVFADAAWNTLKEPT